MPGQRLGKTLPHLLGVFLLVTVPSMSFAEEGVDLKARFLAEAPRGWNDYLKFARHLQLTTTALQFNITGGNRVLRARVRSEFKQGANAALRVYESLEPDTGGEVEASNPSYAFTLKRANAERGWYIVDLRLADRRAGLGDRQEELHERILHTVCDCLTLWNLWLPTLIRDPDFRILSAVPYAQAGEDLVRLEFAYRKPANAYPVKGAWKIKGGWMVVDPEHDWILREYAVHQGDPSKHLTRKRFAIKEGTDRHPMVAHTTTKIIGKDPEPFEVLGEADSETIERPDMPIAEFTLSAFGLPEPGTARQPIPWYLWAAILGFGCLGLGMLLRWRARRAERSVPRP